MPVQILRGLPIPRFSVGGRDTVYRFDEMGHGDAIQADNPASAREVFRRWKHARGVPHLRLRQQPKNPHLLFLVDPEGRHAPFETPTEEEEV